MFLSFTFLKLVKVALMGKMVSPLNEVIICMGNLSMEIDKGILYLDHSYD